MILSIIVIASVSIGLSLWRGGSRAWWALLCSYAFTAIGTSSWRVWFPAASEPLRYLPDKERLFWSRWAFDNRSKGKTRIEKALKHYNTAYKFKKLKEVLHVLLAVIIIIGVVTHNSDASLSMLKRVTACMCCFIVFHVGFTIMPYPDKYLYPDEAFGGGDEEYKIRWRPDFDRDLKQKNEKDIEASAEELSEEYSEYIENLIPPESSAQQDALEFLLVNFMEVYLSPYYFFAIDASFAFITWAVAHIVCCLIFAI